MKLASIITGTQIELEDDGLDTQEFYELMQAYRHTSLANQSVVAERFEEVKAFIRADTKRLREELRVAKEFIAEHVGVEPERECDPNETE